MSPRQPDKIYLLSGPAIQRGQKADSLIRSGQAAVRINREDLHDSLFRGSKFDPYVAIRTVAELRRTIVDYYLNRKVPIVLEDNKISPVFRSYVKERCKEHGLELVEIIFPDFGKR